MADNKTETLQDKETDTTLEAEDSLPPEQENKPSTPRKKRSIGPWLFLLLIFIGLPAAWLLSPTAVRQQAMELLEQITEQTQVAREVQPVEPGTAVNSAIEQTQPVSEPVETAAEPAIPATTAVETVTENAMLAEIPAAQPASTTTPAENPTTALQDEIARLQAELNGMRSKQAQLAQKLKAPETIELRVWLGLLASPDIRLAQRSFMWNYLASRPALHATERERAQAMSERLKRAEIKLGDLLNSLQRLAADIPEAAQSDIIPKPENPYFAWLVGTFHLRHAPSHTEQQQTGLRRQLLDMAHALSLEDWPEPRAWRQLADAINDQFGDAAAELPGILEDIRMDIEASRKQASDWKETL